LPDALPISWRRRSLTRQRKGKSFDSGLSQRRLGCERGTGWLERGEAERSLCRHQEPARHLRPAFGITERTLTKLPSAIGNHQTRTRSSEPAELEQEVEWKPSLPRRSANDCVRYASGTVAASANKLHFSK